jgi:hypothetical protein
MDLRMKSKWIDRQIDEALLLVATQAAFLYAQRRARRVLPRVALGTAVVTGVGAVTAAAAATAAGIGAVGLAGGGVVLYRRRAKSAAAAVGASTAWRPAGGGVPSATAVGANAGDPPAKAAGSPSAF